MARFIGVDMGAEALKVVELVRERDGLRLARRAIVEHHKRSGPRLLEVLSRWGWDGVTAATVTGRLGRQVQLQRVPVKQAQAAAHRFLHGTAPATLVSIGSHGFSVLELRGEGQEVFRENSRCAQGTGNFLRQLVERFDLSVEEAAELAAPVEEPAPLSGRCPVILKTDMTHLANKGEGRERILAGLLDAICENVEVLVKPSLSPGRVVLAGGVARARRVREHFRRFLERHGMELCETAPEDGLFIEATGCALVAADHAGTRVPPLSELLLPPLDTTLEKLPSLASALSRVRRCRPAPAPRVEGARDVVLGFDIGSTGSKAVALDLETRAPLWDAYLRTNGSPVGAAQELVRAFLGSSAAIHRVADRHFVVRNRITWEREKGRGAATNWKNCAEDIWFCTVSDDYVFNVDDVKLKRRVMAPYTDADGKSKDWDETQAGRFRLTHPSNVWTDLSVPFWSMAENTDHPTQKPEKLLAKIVLASSQAGDIVLDPFLGSGTTSAVAKKLGRRYVGIEIDETYCCLAEKRLDAAEADKTIQGYADGVFWERNTLAEQRRLKQPKIGEKQ